MTDLKSRARAFLGGEVLTFEEANALWEPLKKADELSLARRVLERLRDGKGLSDGLPTDLDKKNLLCQQEALLTSKDLELSAATRHDQALRVLAEEFRLEAAELDRDSETLGIAGGILKRRWNDLGQLEDLQKAARFYERGTDNAMGDDAYPHINAAFLNDLLAAAGDAAVARRQRAKDLRERIVKDLKVSTSWWNAATRAEALFGLGRYAEAGQVVSGCTEKPAPWKLETTARQLATLAYLGTDHPMEVPEIRDVFSALLPGAPAAVHSAVAGKVGLALSGGGFRASFYHLGVLARLAELDLLRHVEVLSCVSGGSIVGACYWLALRRRLIDPKPLDGEDYIGLVKDVMARFLSAVETDIRAAVQPSIPSVIWRLLSGEKGAMDPERTAQALEEHFYGPLMDGKKPIYMHDLPFTPADHKESLTGSRDFHPGKHNWLREHKVPVLVLNATTVNTGHAWQFTPTWMGESPWAIHEAADSIERLEWSWYEPGAGWKMELGRAVAASACVPFAFAPLKIGEAYKDVHLRLVDGGVHDNQGTVSLLALNCNALLVSDACGQLALEAKPMSGLKGLGSYALRSMDTLMERVRLANYSDLAARKRAGLLRDLIFIHMKAGLDADTIRLPFSQESYELQRERLSPSGIRKEFQKALSEIRTDLDAFTPEESHALMACGYQMAASGLRRNKGALAALAAKPRPASWPFDAMLEEITSTQASTPRRGDLLKKLEQGKLRRTFR